MCLNVVCSSYSDYATKGSWPVDPCVKLVYWLWLCDKDVTIKFIANNSWDNGTLEDAVPVLKVFFVSFFIVKFAKVSRFKCLKLPLVIKFLILALFFVKKCWTAWSLCQFEIVKSKISMQISLPKLFSKYFVYIVTSMCSFIYRFWS